LPGFAFSVSEVFLNFSLTTEKKATTMISTLIYQGISRRLGLIELRREKAKINDAKQNGNRVGR
jgi:hypothetical protein